MNFRPKRTGALALLSILFLSSVFASSALGKAEIGLHRTNFFLFGLNGKPFYPYAVNASGMLHSSVNQEEIELFFDGLVEAGVNTIRLIVDETHAPDAPLAEYEQKNGELTPEILARLDALINTAGKRGIFTVLNLFDIESTGMNWAVHPHNKKNGGSCAQFMDYFTDNSVLARHTARLQQLVKRYQGKRILAWEVARGPNVWEDVKGLSYRPAAEYIKRVTFWLTRMLNEVKRADESNHLTALCYAHNTLPDSFMSMQMVDINFLQIYSTKTPLTAVTPVPRFIQNSRTYRKPVFIAEAIWKGAEDQRDTFVENLFWASLASNSACFLTAISGNAGYTLPSFERNLLQSAQRFLADVQLDGLPRPPSVAPVEMLLPENFLVVESLVGNDWLYWILRKQDVESETPAQMKINTIEGKYEYFWLDWEDREERRKEFDLFRKYIYMESLPFQRNIIGRLRFMQPRKDPPPPSSSNPGAPNQPNQ